MLLSCAVVLPLSFVSALAGVAAALVAAALVVLVVVKDVEVVVQQEQQPILPHTREDSGCAVKYVCACVPF